MAKTPPKRLTRLARLGSLTTRVTGAYAAERVKGAITGHGIRERAKKKLHLDNAERLADAMSHLKGAAMKVGQSAALAAASLDLPPEVQAKLAKLHSEAEPIPFETIREDIERSLEMTLSEAFADFDESPLGTASLAQAHVARLKTGEEVVVKVLHRGIEDSVATDLMALKTMVIGSRMLRRDRDELDSAFDEIRERLEEELDYLLEAANIHTFSQLWAGDDRVRVPSIHPSHCTERVLTMDRLPGRNIEQFAEQASPEARERAGRTLANLYYTMAFRHRVLHADPHPGNYLFEDDGRIGLLDFGCVKRFDEFWMGTYARAALAAHAEDRDATLEAAIALGAWDGRNPEAGDILWEFCHAISEPLRIRDFTVGGPNDDSVAKLKAIGKRMVRYPEIRVPKDVIFLHRSLGGIYTLARRLQPTDCWGDVMVPHARAAVDRAEGR